MNFLQTIELCQIKADFWLIAQANGLMGVLSGTLQLLFVALAPFVGFALIIHWIERVTQKRLAERFGWKSVLWTGWLGTPIHELSHAAMCWVFKHEIDDIALFEPDRDSGRLGYVRHSFQTGNWFQELGNLFIGIAPLLGGSIALGGLVWLFFPDSAHAAIEASGSSEGSLLDQTIAMFVAMCRGVFAVENFGTLRFWAFIYLVTCVGSHMAPSPSDYQGASRGVYIFGAMLLGAVLVLVLLGVDASQLGDMMLATMGPLFSVLGLAIVLCCVASILVHLVTMLFPKRFRVA